MSDIAISVENLGKRYRLGLKEQRHDTLFGVLSAWARSPLQNFRRLRSLSQFDSVEAEDILWALRDVSFQVRQGEVVGIIGRNGAGKSTLLKILSRITEPTHGRVVLNGRVSSLLEVGTGFHPELTGRENVFLNGTVLGMSKREVERKFDEIVDFSGVEKFIDTPVKRYSSGMKVRLAFAVAAHLEPEILLIDEVLAVGDAEFQKKCLGKMEDVAHGGRTVLFVSHDMGAIQQLCPRGVLLGSGSVIRDGDSSEVVQTYLSGLTETAPNAFDGGNPERVCTGELVLVNGSVYGREVIPVTELIAGEPMHIAFEYHNASGASRANLMATVYNQVGTSVLHLNTALSGTDLTGLGNRGQFICTIPKLPLPLGRYRVAVAVTVDGKRTDHIPNALVFDVVGSTFYTTPKIPPARSCAALVDHSWNHSRSSARAVLGDLPTCQVAHS